MKKMKKKLVLGTAAALAAASFSACINRPTAVYGPPPDVPSSNVSSEDSSTVSSEDSSTVSSSFEPEENIAETVYGPPEWFEPSENIPEDVYGPPSDFD